MKMRKRLWKKARSAAKRSRSLSWEVHCGTIWRRLRCDWYVPCLQFGCSATDAVQLRQSLYKEAAESATEALKDSPNNIKALQRRATANEKLDTWSSLTSALEDYNYLAKLPDVPKVSLPAIRLAQRTIPPRLEQRKTQETQEMMDKLKGLGNSFLGMCTWRHGIKVILDWNAAFPLHVFTSPTGKFGMSTDNFQFVKNEETGGYSMNFVQNAGKK